MKIITRAEAKAQGLKWYYTGKPCKHGHVSERQAANGSCRKCGEAKNAANCKRWYEEKGRNQVLTASRDWVKKNPQRRKEIARASAARMRADPVRNAHKNKLRREGGRNEAQRQRYQGDKDFRLMIGLKARVACALKLQSGTKAHKTAELLGCSVHSFKEWIASKLMPGMSWENYGYSTWHIDHVRPCSSFDLTDPAQQLACFNWANHQPLPASKNMAKSDSWTPEMEAEWAQMMRSHGYQGDLFLVHGSVTMAA